MKWWLDFSSDRQNRYSEDHTTWYELYGSARICFFIDDFYCGNDFIMVKVADPQWPRWMVVWVHHHIRSQPSRMGCLMRRPRYAHWTATHKEAFRLQTVIDISLYLAHHNIRRRWWRLRIQVRRCNDTSIQQRNIIEIVIDVALWSMLCSHKLVTSIGLYKMWGRKMFSNARVFQTRCYRVST